MTEEPMRITGNGEAKKLSWLPAIMLEQSPPFLSVTTVRYQEFENLPLAYS